MKQKEKLTKRTVLRITLMAYLNNEGDGRSVGILEIKPLRKR